MSRHDKTFFEECKPYLIGGLISLVITLIVFATVTNSILEGQVLAGFVLLMALLQFITQGKYFLHLTKKEPGTTYSQSFILASFMLLIIVIGSIWVMKNLNYNMGMSGEQMNEFMLKQNKKGF